MVKRRLLQVAVHSSVRCFSRYATWFLYGRKYDAGLNPTRLLSVAPDRITHVPIEKPSVPTPVLSGVVGGDWDRETRLVADDVVYRSFKAHFHDGVPWNDTDYHEFMLDRLDRRGLEWGQYTSYTDVEERLRALDELYEQISSKGYKSQAELQDDTDSLVRFPRKNSGEGFLPPEFNEIEVDVGRDGELLWASGMHRLCIAKLAEVPTVEVRVRVRHRKWQEIRDAMYHGSSSRGQHPDLREFR